MFESNFFAGDIVKNDIRLKYKKISDIAIDLDLELDAFNTPGGTGFIVSRDGKTIFGCWTKDQLRHLVLNIGQQVLMGSN